MSKAPVYFVTVSSFIVYWSVQFLSSFPITPMARGLCIKSKKHRKNRSKDNEHFAISFFFLFYLPCQSHLLTESYYKNALKSDIIRHTERKPKQLVKLKTGPGPCLTTYRFRNLTDTCHPCNRSATDHTLSSQQSTVPSSCRRASQNEAQK